MGISTVVVLLTSGSERLGVQSRPAPYFPPWATCPHKLYKITSLQGLLEAKNRNMLCKKTSTQPTHEYTTQLSRWLETLMSADRGGQHMCTSYDAHFSARYRRLIAWRLCHIPVSLCSFYSLHPGACGLLASDHSVKTLSARSRRHFT